MGSWGVRSCWRITFRSLWLGLGRMGQIARRGGLRGSPPPPAWCGSIEKLRWKGRRECAQLLRARQQISSSPPPNPRPPCPPSPWTGSNNRIASFIPRPPVPPSFGAFIPIASSTPAPFPRPASVKRARPFQPVPASITVRQPVGLKRSMGAKGRQRGGGGWVGWGDGAHPERLWRRLSKPHRVAFRPHLDEPIG